MRLNRKIIATLVIAATLVLVASSQQIASGLSSDLTNENGCELLPVADRAQVQELVRDCSEQFPGYGMDWRVCIIENPTEWMYDDLILVSTKETSISMTQLYNTPAEEIGRVQLQYKQRTDFNNIEVVNLGIEPEFKEGLKGIIMSTSAVCPADIGYDGGITVCEQTCEKTCMPLPNSDSPIQMRIDCIPANDCVCLIR
ncbi:MAG: hypothetical protein ABIF08_03870 [Nanoarchaeota archaeon]